MHLTEALHQPYKHLHKPCVNLQAISCRSSSMVPPQNSALPKPSTHIQDYTYVYIYIYTYTYVYVHTYTHACTCMCICIHRCTDPCAIPISTLRRECPGRGLWTLTRLQERELALASSPEAAERPEPSATSRTERP